MTRNYYANWIPTNSSTYGLFRYSFTRVFTPSMTLYSLFSFLYTFFFISSSKLIPNISDIPNKYIAISASSSPKSSFFFLQASYASASSPYVKQNSLLISVTLKPLFTLFWYISSCNFF